MDFPNSANAYDSLGEAYMEVGDNKKAIENFKKSIRLNSKTDNVKKMIEKLASNK